MDWIQPWIGAVGPVGLVSIFVIAILTGRLLPKGYVEDLRAEDLKTIERQSEEIREWRTAWMAEKMISRELVSHVDALMESGKITERLLREIVKDPVE